MFPLLHASVGLRRIIGVGVNLGPCVLATGTRPTHHSRRLVGFRGLGLLIPTSAILAGVVNSLFVAVR